MYSHELQTCDWPRNVGCELAENAAPQGEEIRQRVSQHHTASRGDSDQLVRQYPIPQGSHSNQHIPPPPELKIAPNPVITSRGQPKPFQQVDIAKVSAFIFTFLFCTRILIKFNT